MLLVFQHTCPRIHITLFYMACKVATSAATSHLAIPGTDFFINEVKKKKSNYGLYEDDGCAILECKCSNYIRETMFFLFILFHTFFYFFAKK